MDEIRKQNWKQKSKKIYSNQINNKYKKNFGSLQEGRGQAFIQKDKFKRNYFIEKKKEYKKLKFKTETEDLPEGSEEEEEDPYEKYNEDREVFDSLPRRKPKLPKLKKAQKEFETRIKEKDRLRKEKEERITEIEMKRKLSKEQRLKRNIKFTQKTRKGQPLMRSRMEVLLEDIEKIVSKD